MTAHDRKAFASEGKYLPITLLKRLDQVGDDCVTHVHTFDNVQAKDPALFRMETQPKYHPPIVLLFEDDSHKNAALIRLQASEFRFGQDTMSRVEAAELGNDQSSWNKLTYTEFYLVIRAEHTAKAVHMEVRDLFEWAGNVPSLHGHPPTVSSSNS